MGDKWPGCGGAKWFFIRKYQCVKPVTSSEQTFVRGRGETDEEGNPPVLGDLTQPPAAFSRFSL